MKNIPYILAVCAAALAGLPLVSVSAAAADDGGVSPAVLKRFDRNRDGVLDEGERAAWQADRDRQRAARETRRAAELTRYDANHDGKLDRSERDARRADAGKGRQVRAAEVAAAAEARKLARYDRNRNGVLDEDELAAATADAERRKSAAGSRAATVGVASAADPAARPAAGAPNAGGDAIQSEAAADGPVPAAP